MMRPRFLPLPCPPRRCAAALLGLLLCAAPAAAQHAHQHGFAKLEIAVGPGAISVRLDAALDGLVGFERAPRTDAERQRVQAAETRLRDGAAMFAIDPAAGCTPASVSLQAPVLGWGTAPAAAKDGEHADLEAEYSFNCTDATRAGFVNLGLFEAFNRMRRIEVQMVTPRGQMKAELRRPNSRVALTR